MARTSSSSKLLYGTSLGILALTLSGCSLASLPANYSPMEKQTVEELSGSNFAPRSSEEREAIATQDLFAQTAFWSREYDLNPADLEAAINLSANLRRMGNPGKSIEVAQHTRALYPRDVDLMTELAASLIANNETQDAIKILDAALYQRPRNARLWSLKGASLDQLERFDDARRSYNKALQIAPNDPSVLANVGLSYALEGDPRTAEIWLRRAAENPDANPNVRQNLALVLGLQGKLNEAEKWASRDLDQAGAKNNLAYIRSLRGSSTPTTTPAITTKTVGKPPQQLAPRPVAGKTNIVRQPVPQQQRQVTPASYQRPITKPETSWPQNTLGTHGAKISIAGDPTQMKDGPKTVKEAAYYALQQRNAALQPRPQSMPSNSTAPKMQTAPAPTPSVLEKISRNNTPKAVLAQQQRQQLAQRAAYMAEQQKQYYANQQQQRPPYGQAQQPANPNPQYQQQVPQGYAYPQYPQAGTQQQADGRAPARDRRR